MEGLLAQAAPTLHPGELVLRVVVAAALGGVVGFERELRDQHAGLRTHILVSLGSALFTLLGAYGVTGFFEGTPRSVTFDPTRVAAQVVTGIGFLGAGAIIRHGLTVRGLTTAAALWVTAAIGTAVGLGFWRGAVATAIATVTALYGLKWLERSVVHRLRPGHHQFVVDSLPILRLSDLAQAVEAFGARMESTRMETDDRGNRQVVLMLRVPPRQSPEAIAERLMAVEGVTHVDWTG